MAMEKNINRPNLRNVVENLSLNPGAEIVRYGRKRKDVLSLGSGEADYPTPDFIMAGAKRALDMGKTFYGPVLGHEELRDELSDYYKRIYDLEILSNRIFVTGSGTTAMHLALTALLDEGDEAVAITPIWKNLLGAIELAQAKTIEVALDAKEDGWKLDINKLFDKCSSKTKVILITTPSNPTGWVMSHKEIEQVLDFARKRGIWVVSDEVYGRVTYDLNHAPSFLEHAKPEDKLFVINSFSKSWAMTGWRLGWLVGPAFAELVGWPCFC
jgi:aspartate/methionine/tyrosine aminotransferase